MAPISTAMAMGSVVNKRPLALMLAASLALPSCAGESYDDAESIDGGLAHEAATETLEGQTFQDVGDTAACTEDCSGHDAGFEWAKENDVVDPSECGGNSRSFEEGCEAYAEALDEQAADYQSEGEY